VNASSSDGAAVEASTASVSATTPTARERVVRDKAGCN
jgi:riboflavin biosynthesis pyrimidine reductase